jgi:hypothetical protein
MNPRGRKRNPESRASEIHSKLAAWRQASESARPSLRASAREVDTSHQLLSHYLLHWDKWQAKEYRRQAEELRARARTETRPWLIRRLVWQWFTYRGPGKWSARAVGRRLGVSHTYIQKLVRRFVTDPSKIERQVQSSYLVTFADLSRAQEATRQRRDRGWLRPRADGGGQK